MALPAFVRRAGGVSVAVGVLLAAALLYHSLRGIAWRQVARTVTGASPGLLALASAIATTALFLRALRWRILLNADGAVRVSTAVRATAAGYFGNNVLPARAGEVVRTLMISSEGALDTPFVLATALSERIADAVVLVIVSAVVLLMLPSPPGWLAVAAKPFAIAGLLGALVIVLLPLLGPAGRALLDRAPLPHALRPRVLAWFDHAVRGMRTFHDARRLSGFLGYTLVIWLLDAVGAVVGGAALGLRIPISAAFLLVTGLSLGSALPSTPGYVGIYQFVAVTVLTPFGLSRTDAIAFILVAQALMYVVTGFWGSLALLHYRRTRRST